MDKKLSKLNINKQTNKKKKGKFNKNRRQRRPLKRLRPLVGKKSTNTQMSFTPEQLLKHYETSRYSYAKALTLPEKVYDAKIPSLVPLPTNSYHKQVTIPFVCSAAGVNPNTGTNSGKAVIIINPFYCAASSSTSFVLINNSSNLTLNSVENVTGFGAYPCNWSIGTSSFQSYRLVSAAVEIDPQMSLQSAQGTMAGGITWLSGQAVTGYAAPTSAGNFFYGNLTISSNIDNVLYYEKANLTQQQSIRHIYMPLDPSYEIFTNMAFTHGSVIDEGSDFFWVYYITGAPAGASFNLVITFNLEFLPNPDTIFETMATPYKGKEDSKTILKALAGDENLVAQADSNLSRQINEEEKDVSFFDSSFNVVKNAFGFIKDNADYGREAAELLNWTAML
jgi:hypothetical protein